MRSVTVRGSLVNVSDDPHRVLTQLLGLLIGVAAGFRVARLFARVE